MHFVQFIHALVLIATTGTPSSAASAPLCFPKGFLFGGATASYQVEGGWNEGGRTPSIWDTWCRSHPEVACANVADDFYHRYKDDIAMIKEAGHTSFRFSISWSRAMNWDNSTKHMKPNPSGLAYYHGIVDECLKNKITPLVTIYHWDLPVELETELSPSGWLTPKIQDHFVEFAELMYQEFGSKVDYWATFNEPFIFVSRGYSVSNIKGEFNMPPGLGGSDTIQYIAAHNVLLAHARAVAKFRDLQAKQVLGPNARIGMVIPGDHMLPKDPSKAEDVEAADRVQQFMMGWFMDPMVKGDYPEIMKKTVGERLPKFTKEESDLVKGSYDLFMLNHYNTHTATPCDSPRSKKPCNKMPGWDHDLGVDYNEMPDGARTSGLDEHGVPLCGVFSAFPTGYREVIRWMHAHNTSTDILLTENGYCGDGSIENKVQLWYHQSYLEQVHKAITEDKIPVIGYTVWSLTDNYRWGSFKPRFGLYYVNYTSQAGIKESWNPKPTDLARVPRLAARWYSKLAKTGCMEASSAPETIALMETTAATPSLEISVVIATGVMILVLAAVTVRRRHSGSTQERVPLL